MSDIALPITGVSPGFALPGRLLSDERLAKLASAGSERALTVLYQRHHQALYRYCRSIVHDHEDAQDALQSTMTHAFAALRSSDRELAVRAWLFRIAHNEAVSILRKRRPEDCLVDEHEPSALSVERTVDQRERLGVLVADLKALPERQRAALLMRELSGLSIEEIAAVLSVSPGTAKQAVFEARSSLHEFSEGREMECETVSRAISDGDSRVLRGRRVGSHLRGCAGCRDFRALIDTRTADLRALVPPLPATVATAMLARVLAHSAGGGHAGGAAAASTAALGNHAAASLVLKGLVGVAVMAAATAGTLHLARGPVEHKHSSTVTAPVVAHAGVVGRAGAVVNSGRAGVTGAHSIRAARAVQSHVGPGHGSLVSTGIQPEASLTMQPPAIATAGQGKSDSRAIHDSTGPAHRTSGKGSHRSNKGHATPQGPKHNHRSDNPSRPIGSPTPQSSPHSEKSRGGHGESSPHSSAESNGHLPQAHQAPAGKQAADGEEKNETQQLSSSPATDHRQGK